MDLKHGRHSPTWTNRLRMGTCKGQTSLLMVCKVTEKLQENGRVCHHLWWFKVCVRCRIHAWLPIIAICFTIVVFKKISESVYTHVYGCLPWSHLQCPGVNSGQHLHLRGCPEDGGSPNPQRHTPDHIMSWAPKFALLPTWFWDQTECCIKLAFINMIIMTLANIRKACTSV